MGGRFARGGAVIELNANASAKAPRLWRDISGILSWAYDTAFDGGDGGLLYNGQQNRVGSGHHQSV